MGRLANKVVLVTGAGSGIGKACAELYAAEGGKVVLGSLDDGASTVAAAIGAAAIGYRGDVSDEASVRDMVELAISSFGRIDVLHNNVGIVETGGAVETSEESWNRVIANNQSSVFLTCKHVLPHMVAQRGGAIVNIGSVAGLRWIGFPYLAYSASKAAMLAMTQNIALQYAAQGIRANCVLPGLMNTPLIREPLKAAYGGDIDSMIAQRDAKSPTGRMGDAWDTAYAALFLASDEARYISGAELVVDGGLTGRCA